MTLDADTQTMSQHDGSRPERILSRIDGYCLAGLCVLTLVFFAQLWIPGLILVKRDAFQFFLPLKQYAIDRLVAGELPQWFPYEGMGRPFIGIPVTGVFHPFTLLYWWFPVHDAYRFSTLLSCMLGGIGAYLLGRSVEISPLGSVVAAIGFICSGYVVSLTENLVYLYSTCSLPLFLFTIDRLIASRSSRWIIPASILWAGVFLNGDIQTGYYYGFIVLLWALMRSTSFQWQSGILLVLVMVVTVLLAGIQLAPAWVTFGQSDRADQASFHAMAVHWSTHPARLLTLMVSTAGTELGNEQMARALYAGSAHTLGPAGYWAESLYMGVPLIGLALLGARRGRGISVFAILGATSLILALGQYGGLYEVFYQAIPLWSSFRYPEKLMGVATLGLSLLGGAGLDVALKGKFPWWPWVSLAAISLVGYGLLAVEWVSFSTWFSLDPETAKVFRKELGLAVLTSAGLAVGMGGLSCWMGFQPVRRGWAVGFMIVLITVDLARANLPAMQTASAEIWNFTPRLVDALVRDAEGHRMKHFRILSVKDAESELPDEIRRSLTPRERIAIIRKQGLHLEHNALFKIESIQGYLPGSNLLFDQVGRSANFMSLARFNVAYFIGRPSRFAQDLYRRSHVARVPSFDLELVRNPVSPTPRVYLSMKPEALSPYSKALSFLERDDFLRGEVDVLEEVTVPLPSPPGRGSATIVEYRPEFIQVKVEAERPAVLVLLDAYEPGWEAKILEGERLEIFRTNGLARAVIVPGGRSQVIFTYETPGLRIGATGFLVGFVLCLLIGVSPSCFFMYRFMQCSVLE